MTVGFEVQDYSILEDAQALNVCVVLLGITERNVAVILDTMEKTAQGREHNMKYLLLLPCTFTYLFFYIQKVTILLLLQAS